MATEMIRIDTMSDQDRELINLLTPAERLAALREAGRRKVATMHAQNVMSFEDTLKAIMRGELEPQTEYMPGRTYYGLQRGDIVHIDETSTRYEWLGVVPGHDGRHVVRRLSDKKMLHQGGAYIRRLGERVFEPIHDGDEE